MKPEDRIRSMQIEVPSEAGNIRTHLYSRYIGEGTELWMFGTGLGDQTCIAQIGDCFLSIIDRGEDPYLGRIMLSLGKGLTAFMNYEGDHNVAWVWGVVEKNIDEHLSKFQAKPDWVLGAYDNILDRARELGYNTLKFWSGVNPRFFKPVEGTVRKGYGYAGLPKSREQQRIVLEPAMKRGGFEWITKDPLESYLTVQELNAWYNTKRIVFGMVEEERQTIRYMPTRFFETLASGTPLIIYRILGCKEYSGIDYPFMTTSAEETDYLIDLIEADYPKTLSVFEDWSDHVRTKHSYEVRLKELFEVLKE